MVDVFTVQRQRSATIGCDSASRGVVADARKGNMVRLLMRKGAGARGMRAAERDVTGIAPSRSRGSRWERYAANLVGRRVAVDLP